jgi:hypothetical protein
MKSFGDRVRDPRVLYAIVIFAVLLSARSFANWDSAKSTNGMMDFRAFWCAGKALAANANPYLTEPLRSCEHGIPESLLRRWPDSVIPFVHPGYDAAVSEVLAQFPFGIAAALFMMFAFAALGFSIWLLTRTLELPWPFVTGSLLLSFGLSTFLYGQVAAFELLFVAASAAALVHGRDRLAGVLASLTLIEPHIGLFVVLATAVVVPRARVTLALGTVLLAVIAVVATGPVPQMMWLAGLGQQAMAEARYEGQFSLTYVLTALGVPTQAALVLGAVSTLVLLFAAIIVARAFADRSTRAFAERGLRAGVVLIPTAFAVVGGTFIHLTQIALAVPAALLLYRVAKTPVQRTLSAFAVVLLSVPWSYPAFSKQMLGFGLVTAAVVVWHVSGRSIGRTLAAVAGCWIIFAAMENNPPRAEAAPIVHRAPASAPATASWAELVGAFHGYDVERILVKIPTWLSLLLVIGSALVAARETARAGANPAEHASAEAKPR